MRNNVIFVDYSVSVDIFVVPICELFISYSRFSSCNDLSQFAREMFLNERSRESSKSTSQTMSCNIDFSLWVSSSQLF